MNFIEENILRKLWRNEQKIGDVDPLNLVKTLFEAFVRIVDTNDDKGKECVSVANDIGWVFKQLYEKGMISVECETNECCMKADSITDVFINNTKVIWFPESMQNPNFGK